MLRPLGDRIVVKLDPPKLVHANIILVTEDRVRTGVVQAVGPGVWVGKKRDSRRPMGVDVGERVAFFRERLLSKTDKETTRIMQALDDDLALISIQDVLCVISDDTKVEFY